MKKSGFTLVELLAAIAIISILGTIGVVAVLKIYNNNVNKIMIVQENNIAEASKSYLEDYCIDPIDYTYKCPDSYDNNDSIKYVCLSDLQDNIKDNYINKTTYKKSDCKGIITFTENKDGEYLNAKTYLYCGYDNNKKEYEYMTDSSLDISKYSRCDIASGIKGEGETTATTTTTTKKVVPAVACTYSGTLTQGAEYVNGQYTYRYMQESNGSSWKNMSTKGWGVRLTDKSSTDAVTSPVCTTINGIPVTSASYAFRDSKATTIDLSSFDNNQITDMNHMFSWSSVKSMDLNYLNTSKVTNMNGMFNGISMKKLDINALDTRNVINMGGMFNSAYIKDVDLSSFDTSKVIDMSSMFYSFSTNSDTLDISNFNTRNVTDMSSAFAMLNFTSIKGLEKLDTSNVTRMDCMFCFSKMRALDMRNFNTSNVTSMSGMFTKSTVRDIDVSNFDTSKVEHMGSMFDSTIVDEIKGLENFDTSNVKNMSYMFMESNAKTLNLSNFNTGNVTTMSGMFSYSSATEIKGLEKFDTSKVKYMSDMFRSSSVPTLDLSSFDISKVESMSNMFSSAKATTGYAKDSSTATKFNDSATTKIPSTLVFTTK